jgi:hypothetical protein
MNADNPLSILWSALCTVVGWVAVILVTALFGMWLGMCIAGRALMPPEAPFVALMMYTLGWLIFPQIGIGFVVSLVAFYLPLRIDSTRLRVGAILTNVAAWLGVTAWVWSYIWSRGP